MSMIFLIGMPGAGKSHHAKLMSEKYGYRSIDLDEYIEHREGKKISDIFNGHGEAYFREVETSCLRNLIEDYRDKMVVIACGGGTPAFGNNMQLMKNNGWVVYLEVEMGIIAQRVNMVAASRPVFTSGDVTEERLSELYEQRRSWFKQAHYTLKSDEISITNLDKIIRTCTGRQ